MVDALAAVQRRKLLIALLDHNPQDDMPVVIADSERDADAVERLVTVQHLSPEVSRLWVHRVERGHP